MVDDAFVRACGGRAVATEIACVGAADRCWRSYGVS